MSEAHAPRATDLVALVTFDGQVRENLAVTREHLGEERRPPRPLSAAIEQWLHLGRRTWEPEVIRHAARGGCQQFVVERGSGDVNGQWSPEQQQAVVVRVDACAFRECRDFVGPDSGLSKNGGELVEPQPREVTPYGRHLPTCAEAGDIQLDGVLRTHQDQIILAQRMEHVHIREDRSERGDGGA